MVNYQTNTLIGIVNQTATVGVGERSIGDKLRHRLVFCVPKNRDGACFTFRQLLEAEYGNIIEDPDDPDPLTEKLLQKAEDMMKEEVVEDIAKEVITDCEIKNANDEKSSEIAEEIQRMMNQEKEEKNQEIIENINNNMVEESNLNKSEDNEPKKKMNLDFLKKGNFGGKIGSGISTKI